MKDSNKCQFDNEVGSALIYTLVTMLVLSYFLLDGIRMVSNMNYQQERKMTTNTARALNKSISHTFSAQIERTFKAHFESSRDLSWFVNTNFTEYVKGSNTAGTIGPVGSELSFGLEMPYSDVASLLTTYDTSSIEAYSGWQDYFYRVELEVPIDVNGNGTEYDVLVQITTYKRMDPNDDTSDINGLSQQVYFETLKFKRDSTPLFNAINIARSPRLFDMDSKGGIDDNIVINGDLVVNSSAIDFNGITGPIINGKLSLCYDDASDASSVNIVGDYRRTTGTTYSNDTVKRPAFDPVLSHIIALSTAGDEARLAHKLNGIAAYNTSSQYNQRIDENSFLTFMTADFSQLETWVTSLNTGITPVLDKYGNGRVSLAPEGPDEIANTEDDGCATLRRKFTITGAHFFEGDVVISGTYKGQGTIFSGRNIYIAGDLKGNNSVDWSGGLVLTGSGDIQKNLAKPMLGLVARGNIIIGDPNDMAGEAFWKKNSGTDYKWKTDSFETPTAEGDDVKAGALGTWVNSWHDLGYYNDGVVLKGTNVMNDTNTSVGTQWHGDYSAFDKGVRVGPNPGRIFVKGNSTSKFTCVQNNNGNTINGNINDTKVMLKVTSTDGSGQFVIDDSEPIMVFNAHDRGNSGMGEYVEVKVLGNPTYPATQVEIEVVDSNKKFKFVNSDDGTNTNSESRKFYESSISDLKLDEANFSGARNIDAFLYTNHMVAINLSKNLTIHGGINCHDFLSNDESSKTLTINQDIRIFADEGDGDYDFPLKKYLPKIYSMK